MNDIFIKIKDTFYKRYTLISAIIAIVYFFFLLKYYLIDYYVPDYRLYMSFSANNLPAKDGFSSLFLFFTGIATFMPKAMTIFSLIMLSFSIFFMFLFYRYLLDNKGSILPLLFMMCCGSFYYFYGKIYYDFPFSMFTYGLSLLFLGISLKNQRLGHKTVKTWAYFIFMLGLCLSFKPYNVFMVVGLSLLILVNSETRSLFLSHIKKIYLWVILFISGYVVGNYNLLIDYKGTIKGIMAYPAKSDFLSFMLYKNRVIWDHVNDLPFNFSVINIVSAVIIAFILPILLKKFKYLIVSIFMWGCFYVFIERHSPGYAWHGLTFGIFIITFLMFLWLEVGKNVISKKLLIFAIILQAITLFCFYIPKQNQWHNMTIEAEKVYINNKSEIYDNLENIIAKLGEDKAFFIDNPLKRYKPIQNGAINYNKISLKTSYYAIRNNSFVDPLMFADNKRWVDIISSKNHKGVKEADYIIFILPDSFKTMGSIVHNNKYGNREVHDKIHGKGYSIYVYIN